jgi:hypothetical protein
MYSIMEAIVLERDSSEIVLFPGPFNVCARDHGSFKKKINNFDISDKFFFAAKL